MTSTSFGHGPTIAIVGSGPSGCYAAQFLRKSHPHAQITVFEASPAPYGLVRYGIAADHQGAKVVARQFDRVFERMDVAFVGNTRIGLDIPFPDLSAAFDMVVLATGLPQDRTLDVPTDPGASVIGAGALLKAINADPEASSRVAPVGRDVVVVGHGNVAMDVARLLSKREQDLLGSDVHDDALRILRPQPVRTVHVVGRSGVDAAKFDVSMLRELIELENVHVQVHGLDHDAESPAADLLRGHLATQPAQPSPGTTVLVLHFHARPEHIAESAGRTVLTVRDARTGERTAVAGDTVVTAVGFCQGEASTSAPDHTWSGDHVYRVGWLGRGPQGTVAANRKHAQEVTTVMARDLADGRVRTGKPGRAAILPRLEHAVTTFEHWQRIDRAEVAAAPANRCRRKVADTAQMLRLLDLAATAA